MDLKEIRAATNAAMRSSALKRNGLENLNGLSATATKINQISQAIRIDFVTTSAKQRPGVNQKRERINEEDENGFYAGCYCRAELIAFAYDTAGNVGVSFALQNVQKTRDGEAFSGKRAAEDVFDEVEDSSDNASSYGDDDDSESATDDMGF